MAASRSCLYTFLVVPFDRLPPKVCLSFRTYLQLVVSGYVYISYSFHEINHPILVQARLDSIHSCVFSSKPLSSLSSLKTASTQQQTALQIPNHTTPRSTHQTTEAQSHHLHPTHRIITVAMRQQTTDTPRSCVKEELTSSLTRSGFVCSTLLTSTRAKGLFMGTAWNSTK